MKKIAILPKLYDGNGDIRKKWFVYYSFRNPTTDKMERFRVFEGLADTNSNKKERYMTAEILIKDLTARMKQGWNPFAESTEFLFENNLLPRNTAKISAAAKVNGRTFRLCANLFLPEMDGMAPKTYESYVSKYRTFDLWLQTKAMEKLNIAEITPEIIREFVLYLINDLNQARLTIEKYKYMLNKLFEWCVKNKYIAQNPCVDLPSTTRINDQTARPINQNDVARLTDAIRATDPQLWLAVQLEYYCFLRPGLEIRFARIEWFDLARGVINVPSRAVKTRRKKVVIIPDVFRDQLLNKYKIHLYPRDYYLLGVNGVPGEKPVSVNTLRERFNKIRDNLKLPKEYKLYSWKHTGNINAAEAGVPMFHIQQQNGHASLRSTEVYMKNKVGFTSEQIKTQFPAIDKPYVNQRNFKQN
jgi:integrase